MFLSVKIARLPFSSDGNSDVLYKYFYNDTQEKQEITITMSYKDLNCTLEVLEDWLNDKTHRKDDSRRNVARIYYGLVNV